MLTLIARASNGRLDAMRRIEALSIEWIFRTSIPTSQMIRPVPTANGILSRMPKRKKDSQGAITPLTPAEQERIHALLGTVSTRTLLRSLGRMKWENEEAGLIITTLLDRAP
jgi:hypothetical protein